MGRIIIICRKSEVFMFAEGHSNLIDSDSIAQVFFSEGLVVNDDVDNSIASNDIIIFPNFSEQLDLGKKELLKKSLREKDCYFVIHNGDEYIQKKEIENLEGKISYNNLIIESHGAGVLSDEILGRLPKIKNQQDWDSLFQKILNQFHDKELEKRIKAVFEKGEEAYVDLDNYVESLKKD